MKKLTAMICGALVVAMHANAVVALGESSLHQADGRDCVAGLSVDHMSEPGDRGPVPSFSWRMESARQGAAQTAYRIKVFADKPNGRMVWDSAEVADGRSVGIRYAGEPLKGASRYFWTVAVKNEKGEWDVSRPAVFTTGIFEADGWKGSKWISAVDSKASTYPSGTHDRVSKQEAEDGTSCFVKSVPNGKAVKEAWLAVSGLGVFEAYVNGRPVSRQLPDGTLDRDFLKPGFTHCAKTRHSFTYNVTHLVKRGATDANVVAAQVSAGWWRDKIVNFHGKKSAFRAVRVLRHADGTETRAGTDERAWAAAGWLMVSRPASRRPRKTRSSTARWSRWRASASACGATSCSRLARCMSGMAWRARRTASSAR